MPPVAALLIVSLPSKVTAPLRLLAAVYVSVTVPLLSTMELAMFTAWLKAIVWLMAWLYGLTVTVLPVPKPVVLAIVMVPAVLVVVPADVARVRPPLSELGPFRVSDEPVLPLTMVSEAEPDREFCAVSTWLVGMFSTELPVTVIGPCKVIAFALFEPKLAMPLRLIGLANDMLAAVATSNPPSSAI